MPLPTENYYELPDVNPFHRHSWHGSTLDWTGATVEDLPNDESALKRVIWSRDSGDRWDGSVAAIVELVDGRFATWETFYGPTGDGFNEDAYGGDAMVTITENVPDAIRLGLSGKNAELATDAVDPAMAAAQRLGDRDVEPGIGKFTERVTDA